MRDALARFQFVDDTSLFRPTGSHVGRVPVDVSGKEQLMRVLEGALLFPRYFGRNWDALSDCLRDLSWLPPGRVSLVHDALPDLPSEDLRAYVEVLATAAGDWKPQESYELVVVFPERDRRRVLEFLPA